MQHMKKLALVPLEEWEKIRGKTGKEVTQVSVSQAVNQPMNQVVNQAQKTVTQKTPKDSVKQMKISNPVKTTLPLDQMIQALSPTKRTKVNSLIHQIQKRNIFTWNNDGEIMYEDKVIKGSDITKLLLHAISRNESKPKGFKTFYQKLSTLNLPRRIIANHMGKKIIKKYKTKRDDAWRPPGELHKNNR